MMNPALVSSLTRPVDVMPGVLWFCGIYVGFGELCQHTFEHIGIPDYAKAKPERNYIVGAHNFILVCVKKDRNSNNNQNYYTHFL